MSEQSERPVAELAAAILSGAVRLAAATAAWLRLVAEFDEREGWAMPGVKSCAHWLAWQCGLGPGAAREHVRVARALRGLPLIEAAFAEGRLSYSKVRAITRVAEPGTQPMLIEFATEATASQTERVVRQWRRADGVDEAELAFRAALLHVLGRGGDARAERPDDSGGGRAVSRSHRFPGRTRGPAGTRRGQAGPHPPCGRSSPW
jgi:hypothetical protein